VGDYVAGIYELDKDELETYKLGLLEKDINAFIHKV